MTDVMQLGRSGEFADDFEVRENYSKELQEQLRLAPVDAREALSGFVSNGDEFQQGVVEAPEDVIRVVAPAGSGKTQTMVHRCLARVRDGLNPARILVLTFDKAAASSLKQKLAQELLQREATAKVAGLPILTLNAFGYSTILKEYFPSEHKDLLTDARAASGIVRRLKLDLAEKSPDRHQVLPTTVRESFYLDLFETLKDNLFDPRKREAQRFADQLQASDAKERLFENTDEDGTVKLAIQAYLWLFEQYEAVLISRKVMDFNDQKLRAYRCLADNSPVLAAVQNRYSEVIVDEFQDINVLDFEFIKSISAKAKLVVTGDDDQAIYGFRGCTPEYLINLEKHLGRTLTTYELRRNYRCPPNIVEHADRLIRNNTWRIPKQPIAMLTTPSQIKVVSSLGSGLEARWILELIARVRRDSPLLEFKDFAILYRSNAQSLPLQVELILKQVPYHVKDEHNILRNESLERLLGVLRLKLAIGRKVRPAPRDVVLSLRGYFQFVREDEASEVERFFSKTYTDFWQRISSPEFFQAFPKAESSKFIKSLQEVVGATDLLETLDVLSQRFRGGLRGMVGSLEDVADEKVPLGELYEMARTFGGRVPDFVSTIERALETARQTRTGKDEQGGVALRTYFGSKGLQWHTVILIGCNDGIIPHSKSLPIARKVEEERRLFYVGMTRASANLLVSYVQNIAKNQVNPSRFLKEAGLV